MKRLTANAIVLAVGVLIGSLFSPQTDFKSLSEDWIKTAGSMITGAFRQQSSGVKESPQTSARNGVTRVTGRVVSIPDGDTISVMPDKGEKIRVRFLGIDTPESKQLHGPESQKTLERMIRAAGSRVELQYRDKDHYGRVVAFVFANGKNLNYEQVKNGSAWYYRQYEKSLKAVDPSAPAKFAEAERNAKKQRLGLWKDANPQEPWEWRRQHKQQAGAPQTLGLDQLFAAVLEKIVPSAKEFLPYIERILAFFSALGR
jgi:endonuclease YncB( thermonuclease family)